MGYNKSSVIRKMNKRGLSIDTSRKLVSRYGIDKQCKGCGKTKPLYQYGFGDSTRENLRGTCHACRSPKRKTELATKSTSRLRKLINSFKTLLIK